MMRDFLKKLLGGSSLSRDKDLQAYRNLMHPPAVYEDGFSWRTVVGAVFLGFIMMPGTMYLFLVVGAVGSIAEAGRWVMIILFAEVARRSFKDLKMQEVYILYYMAGLTMAYPFQGLLWSQYFAQSEFVQAMGIAKEIPTWWAPSAEQIRQSGPTFLTAAWIAPIMLITGGIFITRINDLGLGYALYRLVNDVEELPFPMSTVGASGITALVNARTDKDAWRWRCFAIGGVLGLAFGALYIGVPVITGALLTKPIQLIPIPFIDFTPSLGGILPATAVNLSFDMSFFAVGMVLPFWAVIGGFVGWILIMIMSPLLYNAGILTSWQPGMNFIDTTYINRVDFFLSFTVGLTVAVALISLGSVFRVVLNMLIFRPKANDRGESPGLLKHLRAGWSKWTTRNATRGDFSIYIALGIYAVSSAFWIALSVILIPGFPWHFFVFYAAVYTPLISYAAAKLEGICGQTVDIPMVREATYILSGYRGIKIWFAPAPIVNYGRIAVQFRVLDLTGTKIKSVIKTMALTLPIIAVSLILFSELLIRMAPVPSDAYPWAQKMWELQARNMCLTYSSTTEGGSLFMEAWKWWYFFYGLGGGVVSYLLLSVLGLPTLLMFGLVRGMGVGTAGGFLFEFLGAIVGRYYFRRKFGDQWLRFTPVMLAGFSCGMGLLAMVAMAIAILTKMMSPLLF